MFTQQIAICARETILSESSFPPTAVDEALCDDQWLDLIFNPKVVQRIMRNRKTRRCQQLTNLHHTHHRAARGAQVVYIWVKHNHQCAGRCPFPPNAPLHQYKKFPIAQPRLRYGKLHLVSYTIIYGASEGNVRLKAFTRNFAICARVTWLLGR